MFSWKNRSLFRWEWESIVNWNCIWCLSLALCLAVRAIRHRKRELFITLCMCVCTRYTLSLVAWAQQRDGRTEWLCSERRNSDEHRPNRGHFRHALTKWNTAFFAAHPCLSDWCEPMHAARMQLFIIILHVRVEMGVAECISAHLSLALSIAIDFKSTNNAKLKIIFVFGMAKNCARNRNQQLDNGPVSLFSLTWYSSVCLRDDRQIDEWILY